MIRLTKMVTPADLAREINEFAGYSDLLLLTECLLMYLQEREQTPRQYDKIEPRKLHERAALFVRSLLER